MNRLVMLLATCAFGCSYFLAVKVGAEVIISTSECGVSKGCFRSECSCTQANCQYLVTYRTDETNDLIEFEVSGNVTADLGKTPYMTMGIGEQGSMNEVYTIGCYWNGSAAVVQDGQTPALPDRGHTFASPPNVGVRNIEASYNALVGRLSCRFQRLRDPGNNTMAKDLRGNHTYYLLAASGKSVSPTGYGYHGKTKWFTANAISFSDYESSCDGGSDKSILFKLHGSIMLFAWLAIGSIGVLLAAHYRITISSTKLLGSRTWLKVHRVLQISAVLLTAVSFITVFIAVGGLNIGTGIAAAHPIIGIIIMSIALVNVLLIFSRRLLSVEQSVAREAVSTGHMVMGRTLYVLSAANIVLGLMLESMQLDFWTIYVVAGLIGLLIVIEAALYAHAYYIRRHNDNVSVRAMRRSQPDVSASDPIASKEDTKYLTLKGNWFRIALLITYTIAGVSGVVVVLCAIFGLIPSQQ